MKQILITMLLLLGVMRVSAQGSAGMSKEEIYKAEVREKLQLDWSIKDRCKGNGATLGKDS